MLLWLDISWHARLLVHLLRAHISSPSLWEFPFPLLHTWKELLARLQTGNPLPAWTQRSLYCDSCVEAWCQAISLSSINTHASGQQWVRMAFGTREFRKIAGILPHKPVIVVQATIDQLLKKRACPCAAHSLIFFLVLGCKFVSTETWLVKNFVTVAWNLNEQGLTVSPCRYQWGSRHS